MTSRPKIRIIILWVFVIMAYGLLVVLTNPLLTLPLERQQELFREAEEIACRQRNDVLRIVPTEDVGKTLAVLGVERTAMAEGYPIRTLVLIARRGCKEGWSSNTCNPGSNKPYICYYE
nr:hypothetical protein [Anaerolineae bacterium]